MTQKEKFLTIIRETPILIKITNSYLHYQANDIRVKILEILKALTNITADIGATGSICRGEYICVGILASNPFKNWVVINTYSCSSGYKTSFAHNELRRPIKISADLKSIEHEFTALLNNLLEQQLEIEVL